MKETKVLTPQIWNGEFGEIRTVEIEGGVWFIGKDVATALGYKDPTKAVRDHVDEEDKYKLERGLHFGPPPRYGIETTSGTQYPVLINESAIYSLVLSSKLPNAKKFKRWVTSEVLPSIRKHGMYATPSFVEQALADPSAMIEVLKALKTEQEERKKLEAEKEIALPKLGYYEDVLQSESLITVTKIAKEFGMSAQKLNRILEEQGIQYKVGNQWVLYQKYANKGYVGTKTYKGKCECDGEVFTNISTYWTQKGRKFIHDLLQELGYEREW